MNRSKLETNYLRALDALMSAVDERQMQAAILRLRRSQARLHGWGAPRSPTTRSNRRRASLPGPITHSMHPPEAA